MCKYYVIVLALTILSVFATERSVAQKSNAVDTVVIFEKNQVGLRNTNVSDIDKLADPITGKVMVKRTTVREPVYVNHTLIKRESPPYKMGEKLQDMVDDMIQKNSVLRSLPDGYISLRLRNIIITGKGELTYYELSTIKFTTGDETRILPDDILTTKALSDAVASLSWHSNEAKYTLLHTDISKYRFAIKKGKVIVEK